MFGSKRGRTTLFSTSSSSLSFSHFSSAREDEEKFSTLLPDPNGFNDAQPFHQPAMQPPVPGAPRKRKREESDDVQLPAAQAPAPDAKATVAGGTVDGIMSNLQAMNLDGTNSGASNRLAERNAELVRQLSFGN